jgi:drug/metabolite transporter (DMT)-like permease
VIWGSSFILIKKGLVYFSPQQVGSLRIVITFLFLLPLAFGRFKGLTKRDWKYLALVGIIGSGAPAFLFAAAQTGIDSSLAGILNSLTPLFTMIIGIIFFNLRIKWFNILGVFIALSGAVGLISVSGGQSFDFNIRYAIYVIIATICYATNVNLVKAYLTHLHQVTITVFSFILIGFPVLMYLLFFTPLYTELKVEPMNWAGIGYVAILGVVGTGLALIAFNKLIKMASPVFAASVTYMIPVVALFWGIADGEVFEWYYLIWILLIIAGVFLVNKRRLRRRVSSVPDKN